MSIYVNNSYEERKETTVVIVTFHPDFDNLLKLCSDAYESNLVNIVIIDNNSLNDEELGRLDPKYNVVKLPSNLGIATAQNEGIKIAISNKSKYVVFFDQDSSIDKSFFALILSETKSIEENDKNLGTIGPVFRDARYGFYYDVIKLNKAGLRKKISPKLMEGITKVSFIISSGSLVPVKVFEDVGLMDEDFFIDYVDTEWCLRAASKGYNIYVTPKVVMDHAIGDEFVKFIGKKIPVHSAFRRYYRIRNAIYFLKMRHIPLALKIRDNFFNLIHQAIIIMKKDNKKEYLNSLCKAYKDGFFYIRKDR